MSTARQKRKPVFDPSALDDDLDDLWPARPAAAVQQAAPVADPAATAPPTSPPAEPPPEVAMPPAAPQSPLDNTTAHARRSPTPATKPSSGAPNDQPRHLVTVTAPPGSARKRTRPPEVLLSSEVYDELYRVQIAEKKVRRGLARTMGTIVLDAIEAHAPRLATTWTTERYAVGEGQLFERPSSNAVPRRRRHATAPRTVVLSGVTAANGGRLDDLVQAWGAGTRSALVEQALRYEFGILPA